MFQKKNSNQEKEKKPRVLHIGTYHIEHRTV